MTSDINPNTPDYIKNIKLINKEMIELQNMILLIADGNALETSLIDIIQRYNILSDENKFHDFLKLVGKISSSLKKASQKNNINNIILLFKDQILEKYSKREFFNLFKFNLPILLCLYENQIIDFEIIFEYRSYGIYRFFLPEFIETQNYSKIPSYFREELEPFKDHLDEFRLNRKEYHSEIQIARIIREDDIKSFKNYVIQNNIPLNYKIPDSIFETDSDLSHMVNSLIEYSAAFGSIQIFEYLLNQLDELPDNILLAAVLGGNFDIFHMLEKKGYEPNDFVTFRSIIAHRNDFFDYFISNYSIKINDDYISDSIESSNYYVFNQLLIEKPEYLTKLFYINISFSAACSRDNRVLFNTLYNLPDLDVNFEREVFFINNH